ncbi:MAG TPA: transposase [Myxococcota bacterium]|nr:transposase [Myxococcota bacterium]
MPRTRRISWLNYLHLVVAQANGGASLFSDDDDYRSYLMLLRQMVRDHLLKVHAFCLRDHEVRLVVRPNRLMLSRIIQRLHGKHSARMNQKLGRVGHLFRGRFRSMVFDDRTLIDVVRSVHLWPVRGGHLRRPELYPWSSHGYYMGMSADFFDFISTKEVLEQFPGDLDTKRRAFGRFVESAALEPDDFGIDELWPGIGGSLENSKEIFQKANLPLRPAKKSSVATLADRTSLFMNVSLDQLVGKSRRQELVMARRLLATAAVLLAGRTVTEVAVFLNRDKAQISRLVAQGMDLLYNDDAFSHMLESLKAKGAISN